MSQLTKKLATTLINIAQQLPTHTPPPALNTPKNSPPTLDASKALHKVHRDLQALLKPHNIKLNKAPYTFITQKCVLPDSAAPWRGNLATKILTTRTLNIITHPQITLIYIEQDFYGIFPTHQIPLPLTLANPTNPNFPPALYQTTHPKQLHSPNS